MATAFFCPTRTTSRLAQGDVISATDPRGAVTTAGYDANRRPIATTLPAAPAGAARVLTAFTWDPLGRLLEVRQSAGGSILRTASATYTPTGNVATTTDANNNVTRFAYDPLDRRISVTDAMGRVARAPPGRCSASHSSCTTSPSPPTRWSRKPTPPTGCPRR
uniref:RHS repeat domain-containing protein n=1 Tax=Reyranella soli TaxID=1230389 RepID=UPI0011BF9A13